MSDPAAAASPAVPPPSVGITSDAPYASPGTFRPIEPRRVLVLGTSFAFYFFGVAIPLAAVLTEGLFRWCSQVLFDPLPTVWHAVLAALVPIANAWVYWQTAKPTVRLRKTLGFVNAAAIGSAAYFCVTFLPSLPLGVIGILAVGLGLLLLGPFFSLAAALIARMRLRCWNDLPPDPSYPFGLKPQRAPFLLAGLAIPALVLGGMEASRWYTLHHFARAASTNPADDPAASVAALRGWGDESVMLDACLGRSRGGSGMSAGWDWLAPRTPNDVNRSAAAFYRVTGRPPESAAVPTGWRAVAAGDADWRGRSDRRFSSDWDRWEEDQRRGGETVGTVIPGLSLASSRVEGTVHPDAATFYAEWTVEFQNDTNDPQEARWRLQLPDDGVVSRVTLWINGEEREAAYGPRGKVRAAYQSVAVVQRRDPVLVTGCGPGRVMMQCFPVPARGKMKTKVGISAPLALTAADRGALRLPQILERNFALSPAGATGGGDGKAGGGALVHEVAIESGRPLDVAPAGAAGTLELIVPAASATPTAADPLADRRHVLAGWVSDDALANRLTLSTARRPERSVAVAADPFDKAGRQVVQTVTGTTRPPAAAVAIVVDGSASMKDRWAELCAAVNALPATLTVYGVIAADEVIEPASTPAALARAMAEYVPVGGQDATPALSRAIDRVGSDGVVIWARGPQPVELSPVGPLATRLARRPNVRLIELPMAPGHNRVADALAAEGAVRPLPSAGPSVATLGEAVAAATTARPQWTLARELRPAPSTTNAADNASNGGDVVVRGNINLARLWAAGEVDRLLRTGTPADRDAATSLAVGHQLVTAVSGAVVLETKQQYDAHDLTPVNAAPLPPGVWAALAMLPVLWLGRRWMRPARAA